jgi:hypothetical protein
VGPLAGGPDIWWNLIPLCHGCNYRMGRQMAFTWIERKGAAAARSTHEYKAARQHFTTHFAAFKLRNPELFVDSSSECSE